MVIAASHPNSPDSSELPLNRNAGNPPIDPYQPTRIIGMW
jgi:hypothetical protein